MNVPEKKFKCGSILACIWAESKTVEGKTLKFYSIYISRVYNDDYESKRTDNFRPEDLPKVALVANEAYKYIRLKSMDSDEENITQFQSHNEFE